MQCNIDDKANDGWSSIMFACNRCHVNVVEVLLSKGANLHDLQITDIVGTWPWPGVSIDEKPGPTVNKKITKIEARKNVNLEDT